MRYHLNRRLVVVVIALAAVGTLLSSDYFANELAGVRFTPYEAVAVVLIGFAVATGSERLRTADRHEAFIVVGLLLLGGTGLAYSLFVSPSDRPWFNHASALGDGARYLMFAGVFVSVLGVARSAVGAARHRTLLLNAWLAITAIVIVTAALQALALSGMQPLEQWLAWENVRGGGSRVASTFRWQGPFVEFMAVSLPLIAVKYLTVRGKAVAWGALYLVGLVAMFFSGSRGALLVAPFCLLPLLTRQARRRTLHLAGAAAAALALLWIAAPGVLEAVGQQSAIERITDRTAAGLVDADEFRAIRWREGLSTTAQYALVGVGPRHFGPATGLESTAHSGILAALVERGAIGLSFVGLIIAAFAWLIARTVRTWRCHRDLWLLAFCCGLCNIFLYQVVAEPLTLRWFWVYAAIACGFLGEGVKAAPAQPRTLPESSMSGAKA